jgi:RNase H-fold protein (predicted Holliday junction resolvase)
MTNAQKELVSLIKSLNNANNVEGSLWFQALSTDLAYWAKFGVETVEDFQAKASAFAEHLDAMAKKQEVENVSIGLVTDLEYWNVRGIQTVEQFEHYLAQSTHYDLNKEVNGIRPRWFKYDEMTTEEIEREIDSLCNQMDQEEQWQKELEEVEKKEHEERKARNAYQPNLALSGLKDLMDKQ